MPVISALRRLRQDHQEFQVSLGYMEKPVSKISKNIGFGGLISMDANLDFAT
jgi:hypothetical protein